MPEPEPEPTRLVLNPVMAERFTGYLIGRLGVHAARHFDAHLGAVGLTRRQWSVLNSLDSDGPVTQQRLGATVGIDPSTMVATIDELERAGLVQRHPHPTDRRAHAVHLTDAGRHTLERARRLAGEAQRELLAPLSEVERSTLHELLLKLARGASAAPPGSGDRVG